MKNPFKRRNRETRRSNRPALVGRKFLTKLVVETIVAGTILYFLGYFLGYFMAARHWSLALGAASVPISRMIKMLYDYWRSKSCLTVADISFRTGIPEQQLHQMIEEKKILPSYLIQSLGKEFVQKYTLQNLGEMMTLLRASEQPDNAATLLRAARDNPSDPVAQQTLLRPIEAEPTQKELIDVEQIGAKITEVKPTGYETVMVEERQIQLRH